MKQTKRNPDILIKCAVFALLALIVNVLPGNSEETWNMKPKGNFKKTLKRGEREGRERDQLPDRIIESLGGGPGTSPAI